MSTVVEAFQGCLGSSSAQYRKGYRLSKSNSPSVSVLCSSTLEPLNIGMAEQVKMVPYVTCKSHDSIVRHMNVLRHTLPLCSALSASLQYTTLTLLQNLGNGMCSWSLTSLAWLLFKELPAARSSVTESVAISYKAASPRVSFPSYSSLHSLEHASRENCSSLHKTSTYLQVTFSSYLTFFRLLFP